MLHGQLYRQLPLCDLSSSNRYISPFVISYLAWNYILLWLWIANTLVASLNVNFNLLSFRDMVDRTYGVLMNAPLAFWLAPGLFLRQHGGAMPGSSSVGPFLYPYGTPWRFGVSVPEFLTLSSIVNALPLQERST